MSSHERAQHDEANNVTYQRCQYAYEYAKPFITGKKVLDVGCGNAYGTALISRRSMITRADILQLKIFHSSVQKFHRYHLKIIRLM